MKLSTLTVKELKAELDKYSENDTIVFCDGFTTNNRICSIDNADKHPFYRTTRKELLKDLIVIDIGN